MYIKKRIWNDHYHTPPFHSTKTNSTIVDTIDTLHRDFLWFQMCPLHTKHNFLKKDITMVKILVNCSTDALTIKVIKCAIRAQTPKSLWL